MLFVVSVERGLKIRGNAGNAGTTDADNTGRSRTMTRNKVVSADVVGWTAAAVVDGAAFDCNAMPKMALL